MIISWSIKGVPRMTQTSPRLSTRKGENLLIEPKQITRPKGIENARVSRNTFKVSQKPPKSCNVTGRNIRLPHLYSVWEGQNPSLFLAYQPAKVRLYLSARACSVPSFINFAMISLTLAVTSESLRKPMPYSSEVKLMPAARSA